ncbi:MAG: cysteine synthase family protein [Candidatus Omnitrophica bacterium]|nr:cysteine synthase family protein [Candidatus Omnitrophota bacterium]
MERAEAAVPGTVPSRGQSLEGTAGSTLGDTLLARIGNTPLLRLPAINRDVPRVTLLAKAEWFNPGGSVKDRAAASIIADAEARGALTRQTIILDATSGNTGVAYAMLGAAKGYRVTLCVPANASPEVVHGMQAYGAEVVLTDPLESSDGAIREAQRLITRHPGRYFYADQYNNPANRDAHYRTTGVEIWQQTRGAVTHLVAGIGTSGTLMGAGRRLKELNPAVQVVAVQPDSPLHGLEGLKHMATSLVPGIYDDAFPDQQMDVSTDEAYHLVKRLAREEGLLVGISSGAALAAALRVAERVDHGVVAIIFPCGGARHLGEPLWQDA